MYQPLPDFPPLFAPCKWWSVFLSALLEGKDSPDAVVTANRSAGVEPRGWMRLRVDGDATLSLPVAGGASALKNRPPLSWVTAPEAGRESRKIMAALATLYGRSPFFHLLKEDVEAVMEKSSCGYPAKDLCEAAFGLSMRVLGLSGGTLAEQLRQQLTLDPSLLRTLSGQYGPVPNPSLSILDPLFRLGQSALFSLLTPLLCVGNGL